MVLVWHFKGHKFGAQGDQDISVSKNSEPAS